MCVCVFARGVGNEFFVCTCVWAGGCVCVCVCPTFVHSDLGQASSSSLPNSVGDGKGHTVGQ